jgi:hypothetical protein
LVSSAHALTTTHASAIPWSTAGQCPGARRASAIVPANADRYAKVRLASIHESDGASDQWIEIAVYAVSSASATSAGAPCRR